MQRSARQAPGFGSKSTRPVSSGSTPHQRTREHVAHYVRKIYTRSVVI
jgi:hypothetical protein